MDWKIYLADFLKITSKWKKTTDTNKYFMIHIPKTAGTTFRYLMYQQFPQEKIFSNLNAIRENGGRYKQFQQFQELSQAERAQFQLIYGHYSISNVKGLKDDYKVLTFLREPIARTVSTIRHIQINDKRLTGKTPEEIYELRLNSMPNMQVRFFSKGVWLRDIQAEDLASAKQNLKQAAFIGLTERFEESLQIAQRDFNWKFINLGPLNSTKNKRKAPISDTLMERITATNQYDIAFYDYAVQLFEERLQNSGKGMV